MQKLQDVNMSYQITVTFGKNDRELTEFLRKREGVANMDELRGSNLRNQLYELMRLAKQEVA